MPEINFDSLESIERMMPTLHATLAKDSKALAVGPKVVAPLAAAIVTLAREVRLLRESLNKQKTA